MSLDVTLSYLTPVPLAYIISVILISICASSLNVTTIISSIRTRQACSMYGRYKKFTWNILSENLKTRDRFGSLGVDGTLILKLILSNDDCSVCSHQHAPALYVVTAATSLYKEQLCRHTIDTCLYKKQLCNHAAVNSLYSHSVKHLWIRTTGNSCIDTQRTPV
jgi:hypothetical protein